MSYNSDPSNPFTSGDDDVRLSHADLAEIRNACNRVERERALKAGRMLPEDRAKLLTKRMPAAYREYLNDSRDKLLTLLWAEGIQPTDRDYFC